MSTENKRDRLLRDAGALLQRCMRHGLLRAEAVEMIGLIDAELAAEATPSLNPNHPVSQFMEGQWIKIVALLMYRDAVKETTIPDELVARFVDDTENYSVAIRFADGVGIQLYLVDAEEGARLARKEGGLPS